MSDLLKRILVAAVLLAVLALGTYFGMWVQAIGFTFFLVFAVIEMRNMFRIKDINVCLPPLLAVASLQLIMLLLITQYGFPAVMLPGLYLLAVIWIMTDRVLNKKRRTEDFTASLFMLVYPILMFMGFGLIGFGRADASRAALLLTFASPCMADNNAYMFGKLFGKHKLCPGISPKKTVEGFIAGIFGGPIGGSIVYFMQRLWGLDIHWAWFIGLGLAGAFIGQMGDLIASTYKRWTGIKDYGKLLPGHGGVMDRFDSTMAFAPVVAVVFFFLIK